MQRTFCNNFSLPPSSFHCIHESHNMCNCEWSLAQKQLQGLYMGWERWGLVGTMQLMGWVSLPRYHSSYMGHHFVLHTEACAVDSALNRCRTSHIERHIVEIVSILLAPILTKHLSFLFCILCENFWNYNRCNTLSITLAKSFIMPWSTRFSWYALSIIFNLALSKMSKVSISTLVISNIYVCIYIYIYFPFSRTYVLPRVTRINFYDVGLIDTLSWFPNVGSAFNDLQGALHSKFTMWSLRSIYKNLWKFFGLLLCKLPEFLKSQSLLKKVFLAYIVWMYTS